jgi:hydroxymethylglutaryl-CoA lyase
VSAERVVVREVGLRDGLQIIPTHLPTSYKQEWIDRCIAAGVREMEVCSFVPERYIPQFKDAAAVCAYARSKPSLTPTALVPNLRGAQRALEAGAAKLLCLLSATEAFSQANLRRSRAQSLEDLAAIIRLRNEYCRDGYRATIQVGISVAFGCPLEGRVREHEVAACAAGAALAGAQEISLADTAGLGDPVCVRRVLQAVTREVSNLPLSAHFHDTRGTGLANVLVGLEAGIRSFDASIGGLGGCPNSPGATGNIAMEDTVFMLEAMGFDTGIDLERLLEVRRFVGAALPDVPMYGPLAAAGLPKGFRPAASVALEGSPS